MSATIEPQLRRWSSYASLSVAVLLVIAKASAWFVTDSLSLLASLVDAVVDVTAALVTVLGVHYAARPADAMHRFGHGKAESLAALIQALLLAGAASVLIFDGLHRLITPQAVAQLNVGLGVIAGSTLLTALLVLFESYVTKRTRSHAIAADRSHHLSDVAANLAVLLALALTKLTGWPRFDPLFAIAIAIFFGWSAFRIARSAADTLLDHELSSEQRRRITQLVRAHPDARGMHDLRTRSSGLVQFIEFHLELDGALSVQDAHTIADAIECTLKCALPSSEVIVHMEPAGISDDRLDDRIESGSAP
jgi:ferrous-iron efflux pump FieF